MQLSGTAPHMPPNRCGCGVHLSIYQSILGCLPIVPSSARPLLPICLRPSLSNPLSRLSLS